MQTIGSIIVPTDFSAIADNAFAYALRLADKLDARIDLVHSISAAPGNAEADGFTASVLAKMEQNAELNMQNFLERGLAASANELENLAAVRTFIRIGDLRHNLWRMFEEEKADLIVMGTHGAKDRWDELIGTNTTFLINRSPCPVIIIPNGVDYTSLDKLCFATDLNHPDVFKAGHLARALRPYKPFIDFVHVHDGDKTDFDLNLLREVFDRPSNGLKAGFTTISGKEVIKELFEYAKGTDCNMLVMSRPHHGWWARTFKYSHTRQAVLQAEIPLLIFDADDI